MEKYIISKQDLLQLLKAEAELAALEFSGVDNWIWYGNYAEFVEFSYPQFKEKYGKEIYNSDLFEEIANIEIKNYKRWKNCGKIY